MYLGLWIFELPFIDSPPSLQYGAYLKCASKRDLFGYTFCLKKNQKTKKSLNVYEMCLERFVGCWYTVALHTQFWPLFPLILSLPFLFLLSFSNLYIFILYIKIYILYIFYVGFYLSAFPICSF